MIRKVLFLTFVLSFGLTAKSLAQNIAPLTTIAYMRYYNQGNFYALTLVDPLHPEIEPTILANNVVTEIPPLWHPKGGVLLYTSIQDNNQDIFSVNVANKKRSNLTNNPAADTAPVWSPDGQYIAFASDRDKAAGLFEIYIMDADGSDILRLTRSGNEAFATNPVWTPDGSAILYMYYANKDAKPSLNRVNTGGTREEPFIGQDNFITAPVWSPDGSLLAMIRQVENECEIYVMNADSSNPRAITHFPRRELKGNPQLEASICHFAWSPDGKWITYSAPQGDTNDIMMVNINGEVRNITASAANDIMPTFSPDSRQIVFASLGFTYGLYRINIDGTGLTPLSFIAFDTMNPVWGVTPIVEF